MLIIAQHNVSNPEKFWNTAKEETKRLPVNLKLHSVYASRDQKTGTCLWEASNTAEVQNYLDKIVGKYAKNFCYEVDMKESFGLPELKKEMAHSN